ncbi:aspartate/glutamate racemase family protein [Pantoea sp. Aalb]|uniref:aspartate/glutamate racemase family protein n=1 Tax=Pantoea sp. Aalb TaxID=2576762 RepID=UPI00132229F7|nr:aspartate/glutamate racemase family protein [Pantoea sp. Aalb]MXP67606.1 Asp/Glu racemase [Pantoea sp. Aalb]
MKIIQVINPNTNLEMTSTIRQVVSSIVEPNTKVLVVCSEYGVASIEGHFDEAIATFGILEQVKIGIKQGVQGHIIACFGDPGLLAAREIAKGPVIGIAEAAMHIATIIATRFSIVTTLPRTFIIIRHLLQQYGFTQHCARLHSIDLPVLDLQNGNGLAQEQVRRCCIKAKRKDGIGAIILGCSGMAPLSQTLTKELDIPVIDGISTAVKILEGLITLGLGTSKYGDLNFPLKKTITGIFHHFN